jgi:translation initiation factor 2B subunit (eIF-2B alpha/beta/delta family)
MTTSFAADRDSGGGEVARAFLTELERWAAMDRSGSAPGLRAALLEWLRDAQRAQPTLALIHQLAARALAVVDAAVARGEAPADVRGALAQSCAAERDDLLAARKALTRLASALVTERGGWIATLSASGAVRESILEAHRAGREPRVLVAESRPRREGRALATALAAAGVPVWLVVDAALPLLISQARMVWLGADAITEQGVINKVGSFAAALAAREHSVPVYALAERRKFMPAGAGALKIVEMPSDEVWASPAPGVQPRNIYFELVPMPLFRGVVVEDAVLPPGEAAALARERPLPAELSGG